MGCDERSCQTLVALESSTQRCGNAKGDLVMLKFEVETIWQDMFNDSFAVPPTKCLEPLPVLLIGKHQCKMCSYAHVLNLRWCPII